MPKSKYETHVKPRLSEVEAWAKDGMSERKIAESLGISYSTFREYMKKYPALSAPIKKGKKIIDEKVENALLKRAMGYEYDEVKETYEGDKLVKRTVVKKHMPADLGAIVFWLKNRMPEVWKNDYHKVKHSEKSLELKEKELDMKGW